MILYFDLFCRYKGCILFKEKGWDGEEDGTGGGGRGGGRGGEPLLTFQTDASSMSASDASDGSSFHSFGKK